MKAFPKRFEPRVTDHAVVRWLEYVHGLDAADVRREILGEGRRELIEQGPAMLHVARLRVSLVVQRGVIITCLNHDNMEARYVPHEFR